MAKYFNRPSKPVKLPVPSKEQATAEHTLASQADPDKVPATIEQAVNMLVDNLTEEQKEAASKLVDYKAHRSLGQGLRNGWSLSLIHI